MNFAEREGLFGGLNHLKAEQEAMATFIPMITHSFGENSPQVFVRGHATPGYRVDLFASILAMPEAEVRAHFQCHRLLDGQVCFPPG